MTGVVTATGTFLDSAGNICCVLLLFHVISSLLKYEEEISLLAEVVSFIVILVN